MSASTRTFEPAAMTYGGTWRVRVDHKPYLKFSTRAMTSLFKKVAKPENSSS